MTKGTGREKSNVSQHLSEDDLFVKRFAAELLLAAAESDELSLQVNWKKEAVSLAELAMTLLDMLGVPYGELTEKGRSL